MLAIERPHFCSSRWASDVAAGCKYPTGMIRCEGCNQDVPAIHFPPGGRFCFDCTTGTKPAKPRPAAPPRMTPQEFRNAVKHTAAASLTQAKLTQRQRAVYLALMADNTLGEVGRKLGIGTAAVSKMAQRILERFSKMETPNRKNVKCESRTDDEDPFQEQTHV